MKNWKVLLGIAVSVVFLYIAFGNIEWRALWQAMLKVRFSEIFLTMVIVASMLIIRGHRWHFFLKPVKKIRTIPLFWSTSIGFGVNNILPARLGEVARAYSIHKKADLKFGVAFGSIVVERLWDTFSILFLFVCSLVLLDFPDLSKLFGRSESEIAALLGLMVTVLLAGVLALKLRTEFMLKVAGFFLRPLPLRWREKVVDLMRQFIDGLTQTRRPLEILWIACVSLGLWVISAFTVWLVIDACGIDLNTAQTMTVLMAMVIAVAIPAAPGYAGTYHYFASIALMLVVDMPKEQALVIATLIHAANYIPQTALGLGALMSEGIRMADVRQVKQTMDAKQAGEV